jgi:predicted RNase H-like HicB family nuclease
VVELPSCISQSKNRKETLANIKEAIEGYLEAFREEVDQLKRKPELVEVTYHQEREKTFQFFNILIKRGNEAKQAPESLAKLEKIK